MSGCGSSALPKPTFTQVRAEDYLEVPFAPRPPPIEVVPPSPREDAVWADGTWLWSGQRYRWQAGTWVVPPAGARYARWVVVRRPVDGQLFFARSMWRGEKGEVLPEPAALARGRSRAEE